MCADPPKITNHSSNIVIPMGKNANLFCEAMGNGKLVYSWERKSRSSWDPISGAGMSSYTTTTSGEYRCTVSNEAGSVSHAVAVNVYGKCNVSVCCDCIETV